MFGMEYLWSIGGKLMKYLWNIDGILMKDERNMHGIFVEYWWATDETCMK